MYEFISGQGQYKQKGNITFLDKVEIDELSYPEEGYDSLFKVEDNSFWFKHRNQCIEQIIKNYPSVQIVDVGGGNGCVAKHLQEKGFHVTLLEPSIKGCMNAEKRGVHNIICGLLDERHVMPNTIDGICLFDVLEHIEDDQAFLTLVRTRMKLEGRLYLTVPALETLWSKEDDEAGHFRRYSILNITRILNNSGFEIEFANYFFSFLYIPIWLVRVVKERFKRKQVSQKVKQKMVMNQHENYYRRMKRLIDYFTQRELKCLLTKTIKKGSSLIIVAKVSAL